MALWQEIVPVINQTVIRDIESKSAAAGWAGWRTDREIESL